ncbi:hypothetical protein G9A89_003709 [Geosiphon pyriformis]|nr:hypothetical protein G9A89_003709 [Geosiphon pyriformis]
MQTQVGLKKLVHKQTTKRANKKKEQTSHGTEEVLQWIKEEQFDFVVITEIKLIPLKEKEVFFNTKEYYAFWESSIKKQMGTGVDILTVAKEIRKLLADIVQNKEIVIVAGDLNEDLTSKSLEETIATNKKKKCLTTTLLQQMNLASNRVQKRLDYVFTDVVTALLVTNIGVIDVNESFSTDHKAVLRKEVQV